MEGKVKLVYLAVIFILCKNVICNFLHIYILEQFVFENDFCITFAFVLYLKWAQVFKTSFMIAKVELFFDLFVKMAGAIVNNC